jgi:hypothetical protein
VSSLTRPDEKQETGKTEDIALVTEETHDEWILKRLRNKQILLVLLSNVLLHVFLLQR